MSTSHEMTAVARGDAHGGILPISSGPCQDRLWRPIITDLDDSLAETLERHREATTAVRNGDATLLIEMLSTRDPLTLFPAAQPSKTGMAEVSQAFRRVASAYTESAPVAFEVVASGVSESLAYVVGYESASSSIGGGPVDSVTLRVTQVYRREGGEWRLVHRHADPGPGESAGVEHLRTTMQSPRGEDAASGGGE
jgi:ketosteroid isomerase-like protein